MDASQALEGAANVAGSQATGAGAGEFELDLNSFDMGDFEQMGQMYLPPSAHSTAGGGLGAGQGAQQQQQHPSSSNMDNGRGGGGGGGHSVANIGMDARSAALENLLGGGGAMELGIAGGASQSPAMANTGRQLHSGPTTPIVAGLPTIVTADMLREQLNQQMRLQQLQQLQNQILQEQIQLISNTASLTIPTQLVQEAQQKQHGFQLLTPTSSSEIRATPQHHHVSPMILQSGMYMNHPPAMEPLCPPILGLTDIPYQYHTPPLSAPAALAFPNLSTSSPADFLTPLSSPVIPPTEGSSARGNNFAEIQQKMARNKRTASMATGDEGEPAAKRHSPSNNPQSSSSPLLPSGRKFSVPHSKAVAGKATRRSVDLTNLPPSTLSDPNLFLSSLSGSSPSVSVSPSPSPSINPTNPSLAPVTPASIMNLGPLALPTGLIPPTSAGPPTLLLGETHLPIPAAAEPTKKSATKSKTTEKEAGKPVRRTSTRTFATPTLKPILPGAGAAAGSSSAAPPSPTAGGPPKKTSHKAAEQKRRDSLKTSFDELRLLLPPIPLLDMDGEEILPGAMPPRGPPRGDGEGPNRGVSKLALLRCGNEFIADLKGKVNRRDEEIGQLREEVRYLRRLVERPDVRQMIEELEGELSELRLDLDRDLDEEADLLREEKKRARLKNRIAEEYED